MGWKTAGVAIAGLAALSDCAPDDVGTCELAGTWTLEESAAGGDCPPELLSDDELILEIEENGAGYLFRVGAEDRIPSECAGVVNREECSAEIACAGQRGGRDAELSLELSFGSDSVSGTETLSVVAEECSVTYRLSGARR